jgi:SAM-dependent methyltransferase
MLLRASTVRNPHGDGKAIDLGRHLAHQAIRWAAVKALLNVGSGMNRELPPCFAGWKHDRLDIDPSVEPDVLLDARNLSTLAGGTYDAVYCCHNLEHYFLHDAARVARGFAHVLKPDGFAYVNVPDLGKLMQHVAEKGLDVDDVLYQSEWGPIRVRDVIYGFQPEIERSGVEFFAHRNGFTEKSLTALFTGIGFESIVTARRPPFDLIAFVFKQPPSAAQLQELNVKVPGV